MTKCNWSGFNNPIAFNKLYICFIHFQLEYGPLIWKNYSIKHNNEINDNIKKISCFICFKCKISRTPESDYDNILNYLNL